MWPNLKICGSFPYSWNYSVLIHREAIVPPRYPARIILLLCKIFHERVHITTVFHETTLYRNALWETLRTLTSQQAASYLQTCYKVIYILFLCARYFTTLLSFYDPPKLHLVWFSFYKRCGSDILQQRSSKSTRQLSPMYINLQMNVLYVSIFSQI